MQMFSKKVNIYSIIKHIKTKINPYICTIFITKIIKMIKIKTREQIEIMRESALVVSRTLGMLAKEIKEGVTTLYLDKLAEEFIREQGAIPGFLGLYNFPNTLCVSPNAQVVHGIPNNVPLKSGDIVSVDCGAIKNYCEKNGYGVVRELVGHGLGTKMHEDPEMPNYGKRGRGKKFVEGMTVAIEPMINMGTHRIKQLRDGWTILTADGKPSAHFEHDVALVDGKPKLLSTFKYIYEALGIESNEEDEFLF